MESHEQSIIDGKRLSLSIKSHLSTTFATSLCLDFVFRDPAADSPFFSLPFALRTSSLSFLPAGYICQRCFFFFFFFLMASLNGSCGFDSCCSSFPIPFFFPRTDNSVPSSPRDGESKQGDPIRLALPPKS